MTNVLVRKKDGTPLTEADIARLKELYERITKKPN
jgi:hypothetical protein